MTKKKASPKPKFMMSVEEFSECGFVLGATVLSEIIRLVTSHKLNHREMKARVKSMVTIEMARRRQAFRENEEVRQLVLSGRYEEARKLAESEGAR